MFKKGNTYGKGRPKGKPNKLPTEVKELLGGFVRAYFSGDAAQDWAKLKPGERLNIAVRIATAILPRTIEIPDFSTTTAAELLTMTPAELDNFREHYQEEKKKALKKGATINKIDDE